MLETHLIETFVEVAERGSVTAAAQALNRSQPAISHRLRQLEESVGVALFEPDGRGLKLTAAGRRFHREVAPLVTRLRELPGSLSEPPVVRVGVVESLSTLVIAAWLQMPEPRPRLTVVPPRDTFADLVITTTPAQGARKIAEAALVLCGEGGYLEWSSDEPAAAASRVAAAERGLGPPIASVPSPDWLAELVRSGAGRAIIPSTYSLPGEPITQLAVYAVSDPNALIAASLVTHLAHRLRHT